MNTTKIKHVLVRTESAGCFYVETLEDLDLKTATAVMINARRLWYWDGAATLSELATQGVSKPENCKFPKVVPEEIVFGIIEIIPCSKKAIVTINEVKEWSAH